LPENSAMNEIVKIRIQNELDIVLAYKRAKQLSEYTGMNISSQTKFATAVSEICRNVLEHVGEGNIKFGIVDDEQLFLEAQVSDRGRGIDNIEEVLNRVITNQNVKGCGISNSKKLVDQFTIDSKPDNGTKVRMRKKIPRQHPPINNLIIQKWKDYFIQENVISPYEEIKQQNMHLIEVMDALKLKNLEAEEQINEIKRLNSDLDKFAYTVSHDLKAPLKNMEAITNMIEDSLKNSDIKDALESCDILKNQTSKMDRLITDILAYAKEGKQNIKKDQVNIYHLVCEVITTLKVPKNFQIKINESLPVLFTEEVLLNQVFSNLISNAIKYQDKPNGIVDIDFKKDDKGFIFSVEDDGPGISEADAKKIFNIFQPLMKTEDSTGIGLSIVKNIVTEKGGKVWLESLGRGSKFLFTWQDKEISQSNHNLSGKTKL
jgi:signal transduction histidine kinase